MTNDKRNSTLCTMQCLDKYRNVVGSTLVIFLVEDDHLLVNSNSYRRLNEKPMLESRCVFVSEM